MEEMQTRFETREKSRFLGKSGKEKYRYYYVVEVIKG